MSRKVNPTPIYNYKSLVPFMLSYEGCLSTKCNKIFNNDYDMFLLLSLKLKKSLHHMVLTVTYGS